MTLRLGVKAGNKMFYVDELHIENFWGDKRLRLAFDRRVSFLIGRNGSGKTTIINLLAAILKADKAAIEGVQFSEATVELKDSESPDCFYIKVERPTNNTSGGGVSMFVRRRKNEAWQSLALENSDFTSASIYRMQLRIYGHDEDKSNPARDLISKYIMVNWLSINRNVSGGVPTVGKSAIDNKLSEISNALGAFMSSLDSKAAKETKQFEEYVFLSLLTQGSDKINPFSKELDIDVSLEKSALNNIFRQFQLIERNYKAKLDAHSEAVQRALQKREDQGTSSGLSIEEFSAIRDSLRIKKMIGEWTKTQDNIRKAYAPKLDFIGIFNKLLINKKLRIDERNLPIFTTKAGKSFGPELLSSGENSFLFLLEKS